MKKIILLVLTLFLAGCQQSGTQINMDKAQEIALAKAPGQIVSAKEELNDLKTEFDINILYDNVLHEFEINYEGTITSHEQTEQLSASTTTQIIGDNADNSITADEANEIALADAKGGEVISNKLDKDNGVQHYDIELLYDGVEHDYEVSTNGYIVAHEQERVAASNTTPEIITADKAASIAIERVGGGTVVENYLDTNDGIQEYDIEVQFENRRYDVEVNALTGDIISYELND